MMKSCRNEEEEEKSLFGDQMCLFSYFMKAAAPDAVCLHACLLEGRLRVRSSRLTAAPPQPSGRLVSAGFIFIDLQTMLEDFPAFR